MATGARTSFKAAAGLTYGEALQRSRNGVKLTMDDSQGQEQFIVETPGGQKVTLKDGPGAIDIEDSNGNSVKLEAAGITIQASAKVKVMGLSHTTLIPASQKALAIGKWVWFGVAIETKSTRSPRGSLLSSRTISK